MAALVRVKGKRVKANNNSATFGGGANLVRNESERSRRQTGDGVAKSMTALPTRVRRHQARSPLGQFASHATDVKIVHTAPARKLKGDLVEARGRGGLAPSVVHNRRGQMPNSNSPNGAAVGHRLP